MKIRNKRLLTKTIAMAIFMSSTLYTMPITQPTVQAATALDNNFLPQNPDIIHGQIDINNPNNNTMNINQGSQNAIIKWGDFSIGANGTVNFNGQNGFNTLNYVNSGKVSQIYGTMNANGGNIYIVNTAGVQIGNSAQINVGSLYVSNKNLDTPLKNINKQTNNVNINNILKQGTVSPNAELMSLGNINATNVTFDGNRVVLDVDRVNRNNGQTATININSTDEKNVVLGTDKANEIANKNIQGLKGDIKDVTYTWIRDLNQLQNMNSDDNYALRNSIDASATEKNTFNSINSFSGKFDGLGYNIFDFHGNNGLFASADGATIRNFNMISGVVNGNGKNNIGAVVGSATNSTIENILNTTKVTGQENVGSIVGSATNSTLSGLINTGAIEGTSNVGGLVGSLTGSTLNGESYNLGNIKGSISNVGGLVGTANNVIIGNENGFQMYNHLDVTGGYNVGGIVGNLENGSTIQNVYNDGNILAIGRHIDDTYTYHSASATNGNTISEKFFAANAGGIVGNSNGNNGKNKIKDVSNKGNITTKQINNSTIGNYYTAGNVGGIVGRADNTDITNATNIEANIRGANNIGGIAGYFANGTVENAVNNGGDIMATGARNSENDSGENHGFVKEIVRGEGTAHSDENFIVGNSGGIVGYLYGDNAYITKSANRGTVHSQKGDTTLETAQAANVGGIVGKIDRSTTQSINTIKGEDGYKKAAISNSYNTGDVDGFTGVGGIAGMMYNGEIAGSYNLGKINSTRESSTLGQAEAPLNLGGIVGDATEESNAKALLYDVYNKGEIGDSEFKYIGRHIGGIAGRFSGDIEKAYNNGSIYAGRPEVGGIIGWWAGGGTVQNVFNTGNITVVNSDNKGNASDVGGIVGGVSSYEYNKGKTYNIKNAYNLGTIRSFKEYGNKIGENSIAGILGNTSGTKTVTVNIENVYTLGNLYAGIINENGSVTNTNDGLNPIYGNRSGNEVYNITNAYYIKPEENSGFAELEIKDNANKAIDYENRDDINEYSLSFSNQNDKNDIKNENNDWRIYDGTTPILNAFIPNTEDYFGDGNHSIDGITGIQYGTAYDPLLTIINVNKDISLDWGAVGINNSAGIAVYGGGLNITDFINNDGYGMFSGIIYTDGALTIDSEKTDKTGYDDILLGSGSNIYGSSIDINAGTGDIEIYGNVISTGKNGKADISITGKNISTYGTIQSAKKGDTISIAGIGTGTGNIFTEKDTANINNPNYTMPDIGDTYYGKNDIVSNGTGNINITADEDVNILYGNKESGLINTGGDLNVTSEKGNIYIDSDMIIEGNLNATAKNTEKEIIVDISNIGKVSLDKYTDNLYNGLIQAGITGDTIKDMTNEEIKNIIKTLESDLSDEELDQFVSYLKAYKNDSNTLTFEEYISDAIIKGRMHNFLHSFYKGTGHAFNFKGTANAKLTVDLWNGSAFDLGKYDIGSHTLNEELNNLNISINGNNIDGKKATYIWVADGKQLNGIQGLANQGGLGFNFALKNDINATNITDYQAIGSNGTEFTGTFDGRGNRIIGLTGEENNGIFGTIGQEGTVKNLKVYSSTFTGNGKGIGAIANTNNGTIDNITGLGNNVSGTTNVGGFVGTNNGAIKNSSDQSSIISDGEANAGGLVGTNEGTIENSTTNSSITSTGKTSASIGGIAGINNGHINNVDSLGVTSGLYKDLSGNIISESNNVGGIVGINNGEINSAYNESIVTGQNNVGGIVGSNSNEIDNVASATSVTGDAKENEKSNYVGGLVGYNTGSITNGRNNGTITGQDFVGGMVGYNGKDSTLTNLVNDDAANITGENNVGGIAGQNDGTIKSDKDNDNLINRGIITGQNNVGGIAGTNNGTIDYVKNDIILNVKNSSEDAIYFGGVAGINNGTINNATNRGDVNANGATYVGGIVGQNNGTLSGMGNSNEGNVTGKDYVGGVAGQNNTELTNIGAKNEGIVTATNGGAGGIFGENTGDITNSELSNSGTVQGNKDGAGEASSLSGTGGLIGFNSGNISNSSLKNEVNGKVSGVNNVGGLIGINSGEIIGGRDEADTYYKYQIYNNGTITATGNGSNIGGLIGYNKKDITTGKTGSLTAGYNTGNIVASGSSNVGGIVGTNEGIVDQVFNTIMTVDGKNETIVGGSNVGAIIGDNTKGTLTNAYSTNGGISTLVGIGNSNNNTEKDQNGAYIWKTYIKDGKEYKVLKVFLTSVGYDPNKKPDFVYNGQDQSVDIGEAITSGMLTDLSNRDFSAHENANLIGSNSHKNAGKYTDWLYSGQIASSGEGDTFNPNNLGYDIDLTTEINKKKLTITGTDIERIYGNLDIKNGKDYGFIVEGWVDGEDFSDNITWVDNSITDGALTGNTTGKVTNDVNDYFWIGKIIGSGEGLENYEFDDSIRGSSKVSKATIDIVAGDTTINKGGNPAYGGSISGIVNGDTIDTVFGSNWSWGVENSTLEGDVGIHEGVITINVGGKYYYFDDQQDLSDTLKNYNVNIEAGDLTVNMPITPIKPIKPLVPSYWNHLYQDQWDRNHDFKERKAEFNFVDGAISLDEAVEEV